ncbi:MAG: hypothetical protein AB1791_23950 [Chloroflexota bacterium]
MASELPGEQLTYQPSAAQVDRAAALRRFNFFYVYFPFTLLSLFALLLLGTVAWYSLFGDSLARPYNVSFASGLADVITILCLIPLLLGCPVFPLLVLGAIAYGRRQGKAPLKTLQRLLWQLETRLNRLHQVAERLMRRLARVVIDTHVKAAYVRATLARLRERF